MQHWIRTVFEDAIWNGKAKSQQANEAINRIVELIETNDVHMFRTADLESISTELSDCDDLNDLSELMWHLATSIGFQNFTIFVLQQGAAGTFKSRVCTSYNEDWIERYQARSYQFVDPVMAQASARDGWFLYSDLSATAPVVRDFWDDAEVHRIGRNGVCFAMTRLDGTRIGVSFSSMNSKEIVQDCVRLNGFDLQFLASQAVDSFCNASFGRELMDDTLTMLELRFLHVLSSSSQPDEALKISAGFGSNKSLQASIRSKLGVDSVYQAIAIAASKGWFNQLPYDPKEVLKPFRALERLQPENDAAITK